MISTLLFDLDGTIADTETLNSDLLRAYMRDAFGVPITAEDEEAVHGYSWRDTFARLRSLYGIGGSDAAMLEGILARKRSWLAEHPLRRARGLEEILALPVRRAIVSGSARPEVEMVLAAVGLSRADFDAVLSIDEFRVGKPDPSGFHMALEALGARPESALVFEDSRTGIASARAAGVPVAFLRELAQYDLAAEADMGFDTFREACAWLLPRIVARR